ATYAAPNSAGTPVVKEPKFTALARGGGFARMAVFGGPDARTFLKGVVAGEPEGLAVLHTDHAPQPDRKRVRWDFATATDIEGSPQGSAATPCLNVAARSFPVAAGGAGIRRTDQAAKWEGAGLGLDRWGVESAGRPKAYPRDTRGDDSVSSCKVPLPHKKLSDVDLSTLSESATPSMDQVREWELGGWKSGSD